MPELEATAKAVMKMMLFFVLACLLPLSSAMEKNGLEKIRLYYGDDGIDTATVHISYPHSPNFRRLTKREALNNLKGLPGRLQNFTVKVTLKSSGHVLDLQLERSRLRFDGALVTVMKKEGSEKFQVQDEKCHYQGYFDDNRGIASVHFCQGVLVGAAFDAHTDYSFHSHHHPLLGHPANEDPATPSNSSSSSSSPSSSSSSGEENELYHTIVSWKKVSEDSSPWKSHGTSWRPDHPVEEQKRSERNKRQTDSGGDEDEDDEDEEEEETTVPPAQDQELKPPGGDDGDNSADPEFDSSVVPVAEFGILLDEDFLEETSRLYPKREDLIQFIIAKYTGVQAIFGNPKDTDFEMKIEINLIYFWNTNPSYYKGSTIPIGQRMGVGREFGNRNPEYKKVDSGALYTGNAPGNVEGMGFVGGACLHKAKTFVTRSWGLNWITECHEFGHTLGLVHLDAECKDAVPPWNEGFMNSFKQRLLPCVVEKLKKRIKLKRQRCFFVDNIQTTNIPPIELQPTWPILALGYNHHCRTYFTEHGSFVFEEDKPCGAVLCAVTDFRSDMYGLAQVTKGIESSLNGRSCGPNGMICIDRGCKLEYGNTTIRAIDTVTGTGSWGHWFDYSSSCTSACGVGVLFSFRKCSNEDRPAACRGTRVRGKLCNTQPCPGDDLMTDEKTLRTDRITYSCNLLKSRHSRFSKFLKFSAKPVRNKHIRLSTPISIDTCIGTCRLQGADSGPRIQRRKFGSVMQIEGTLCGPIKIFDRKVLGVTARCLFGRCVEFGCDGNSMGKRDGKIKDMCGVCGGDNSTCNAGQATVSLSGGGKKTVVVLPAGTKNIVFGVKPGSDGQVVAKLGLFSKDDNTVIVPYQRGRFKIKNNEDNPLNFAGTHWITVQNEVLSAPGPLDQPMKVKVQLARPITSGTAVVVWGYRPSKPVPSTPKCVNGGTPNNDIGGCICVQSYIGRRCEFHCRFDFCFNGGQKTQPKCKCKCPNTVRTNPKARCACNPGFAGPDCSQCAIKRCFNGGVLDTNTCQCDCPKGCGKADCSNCNHNPLLPKYAGQYGRGSLEKMAMLVAGGASTVLEHAGFVSKGLVAMWFFIKLFGVHIL